MNKFSIKYFIVSTCELFASERLILRNSGLLEFADEKFGYSL